MKTGILLSNLGSPSSLSVESIRAFLAEFLWDPRVIGKYRAVWWLILNGIILRLRPKRILESYSSIWLEEGSPLTVYSQQLADALQESLQKGKGTDICVELGMRYGEPSMADAFDALLKAKIDRLIVFPLYPQYSTATTASTMDKVNALIKPLDNPPEIIAVEDYAKSPKYIDVLAASIEAYWKVHGRGKKLLMSYHGMPVSAIKGGDPYADQCEATSRLLAKKLKLKKNEWMHVYQSRFGFAEWLQPYCDKTLESLAQSGVGSVDVVCPGFAVDCLETLEEIEERYREVFIKAGGKTYHYIPALNASKDHVDVLKSIVLEKSEKI